ncbi:hypothetical protein [Streptomyces endophyticus]|uniref:Uncharacterized protein n=1 Tax=Streptomyces endophyticus TaxID=714166 RepID=A0ABU6F224_9ACTN|nr:hypothetical protein [Streptomyces endophyticus]MEB8338033.1 hypothetical protein [Streptomyces endophyticus]
MADPIVHPYETLTTRDGQHVEIDEALVPVIRDLWRLGFRTLACCQDVGEATAAVRAQADRPLGYGAENFIAFHRGWALLKLPLLDAMRLVDLLATEPLFARRVGLRWRPGCWRMNVPLEPNGLSDAALLHFPVRQIPELADVLLGR